MNNDLIVSVSPHYHKKGATTQRVMLDVLIALCPALIAGCIIFGLRSLLRDRPGVLMGISAGTMNSADTIYAQPERPGEAVSPEYRRFLPGLGLTETMVLPHYQMVKDDVLDGLRLFADITLPDSLGRTFYAIPDGSYLLIEDGRETLRGEAYEIRDGRMRPVSAVGGELCL